MLLLLLQPLMLLHWLLRGCCSLQGMGISVDAAANQATLGGEQGDISAADSRIKVLVIPTDEELSIAQQTLQVVDEIKRKAKVAVAA